MKIRIGGINDHLSSFFKPIDLDIQKWIRDVQYGDDDTGDMVKYNNNGNLNLIKEIRNFKFVKVGE